MRVRVRPIVLLVAVLGASPMVLAKGHGGSEYSRAADLHGDGRYDEAAAGFIASYQAGYREETSAYNAACALARAGKKDEAFKWLDKAYEAGFDLDNYLDDDRDLRSLRADPRFTALQSKVLNGRVSRHAREAERMLATFNALRGQKDVKAHRYDSVGRELIAVGRFDEAAQSYVIAAGRSEFAATSLYNAACARSLQGDKAAALALLQQAVEQGFADPRHLDEDDDLDSIRREPKFQQIRALAVELEVPNYLTDQHQRTAQNRALWQAALPKIEAAVASHPQLGQTWFNLGFARIVLGPIDQAAKPFEKAVELGYRKGASMYNIACALALAGRKDEAFAALEKAFTNGFEGWGQIRSDADLDDIRYDPRFRKYLEQARLHENDWNR